MEICRWVSSVIFIQAWCLTPKKQSRHHRHFHNCISLHGYRLIKFCEQNLATFYLLPLLPVKNISLYSYLLLLHYKKIKTNLKQWGAELIKLQATERALSTTERTCIKLCLMCCSEAAIWTSVPKNESSFPYLCKSSCPFDTLIP